MEQLELRATRRELIGKQVRHLRGKGFIPSVLYGHRVEPVPLQIEARSLVKVLQKAGANTLIAVRFDGGEPRMALVREVQLHPVTRALLHVDLYEVIMTEKITTQVPIVLLGEPPVVVRREGILVRGVDSVEIECLPGDLIHSIEVSLDELTQVDQAIMVRELSAGPNIKILSDPNEVVVQVLPVVEEVIEELLPAAPAEVEVIGKGKEEEQPEAEAETKAEVRPKAEAKPKGKGEEKP